MTNWDILFLVIGTVGLFLTLISFRESIADYKAAKDNLKAIAKYFLRREALRVCKQILVVFGLAIPMLIDHQFENITEHTRILISTRSSTIVAIGMLILLNSFIDISYRHKQRRDVWNQEIDTTRREMRERLDKLPK